MSFDRSRLLFVDSFTTPDNNSNGTGGVIYVGFRSTTRPAPPDNEDRCIDSVAENVCLNATQIALIILTGCVIIFSGLIHLIVYLRRERMSNGRNMQRPHLPTARLTTTMTVSVISDQPPPRYSQIFGGYTNEAVTTNEAPPPYDTVVTFSLHQTTSYATNEQLGNDGESNEKVEEAAKEKNEESASKKSSLEPVQLLTNGETNERTTNEQV